NSAYYSLEISETDEEDSSGKRKIIIKDLKWHLRTLQIFLCDYVDHIFTESSKVLKKWTQIYDNDSFYDKE
ncbi:13092_t:CDS:2, partial [Funneliformis mosseae]